MKDAPYKIAIPADVIESVLRMLGTAADQCNVERLNWKACGDVERWDQSTRDMACADEMKLQLTKQVTDRRVLAEYADAFRDPRGAKVECEKCQDHGTVREPIVDQSGTYDIGERDFLCEDCPTCDYCGELRSECTTPILHHGIANNGEVLER